MLRNYGIRPALEVEEVGTIVRHYKTDWRDNVMCMSPDRMMEYILYFFYNS